MSGTFLAAPYQQRALLAIVILGVVAAVVGVHVVLRRMAFVADAMSHTVLPGVVVANLLGGPLYAGALVAGVTTAMLLGFPARARRIGEDAAVAIVLASFFALGVAIVSRGRSFATDLTGFLFGSLLTVDADDLLLMGIVGGVAIVAMVVFHKELVLRAFDREAAEAIGLPIAARPARRPRRGARDRDGAPGRRHPARRGLRDHPRSDRPPARSRRRPLDAGRRSDRRPVWDARPRDRARGRHARRRPCRTRGDGRGVADVGLPRRRRRRMVAGSDAVGVNDLVDAAASLVREPLLRRALLEIVLVGALGGVVGVHVVLRRLPFFVMTLSHATLPGLVVASLLGVSLVLGAAVAAVVVVGVVVLVGVAGRIEDTSGVGVVLTGSLAVGALVLSIGQGTARDLSAFLVGSVVTVRPLDVVLTAGLGLLVVLVLALAHKELVLVAFDPAAADAAGYQRGPIDLLLLVTVAVTLAVAVPAGGVVLSVALLVTPASAARLWCDRVVTTMALAATFGVFAGVVGLVASAAWDVAAGAAIALAATAVLAGSAAIRALAPSRGLRRT